MNDTRRSCLTFYSEMERLTVTQEEDALVVVQFAVSRVLEVMPNVEGKHVIDMMQRGADGNCCINH